MFKKGKKQQSKVDNTKQNRDDAVVDKDVAKIYDQLTKDGIVNC